VDATIGVDAKGVDTIVGAAVDGVVWIVDVGADAAVDVDWGELAAATGGAAGEPLQALSKRIMPNNMANARCDDRDLNEKEGL
jgi:hypothetical protein